ncbi:MAG: FMN-binding protein [Peptoniphilaceae bacterium]|nr:FMN-binding protein [Peptoniphilaceae bacterium]MDY6018587.1 FMN-binding protein [Anaerococcus sp.]
MNKSLKLGLKLFIITAVSGTALALTNNATAPVIEAANQAKLQESLKVVYKDASFEQIKDVKLPKEIVGAYKATGSDGKEGYVFDVNSPGGYGGPIEFLIGVGPDNKLTGFSPLVNSESAGFGKKMEEDSFGKGVVGVSMDDKVGFSDSGSDSEIVGISGATISTTTIVKGINIARETLEKIK